MHPKVFATIPVLDEFDNLHGLISDLNRQTIQGWQAIVCVNQPDDWWNDKKKAWVCQQNQRSLDWLRDLGHPQVHLIDKSSPGKGWKGKQHGVGWARKTAMDYAASLAESNDLIVSMDADTSYLPDFFASLIKAAADHPEARGISVPYYHRLTGDEVTDRCILRYELYMRNYALNMLLIENPYAFSVIGSGMACRAKDYRQVGGLTPKMSGEDFYFMLKLRKAGHIIVDSAETIYPAARFSDRVYFGTGPAMIKGRTGDWSSYPVYAAEAFAEVKQTFETFSSLYCTDIPTPMDPWLSSSGKDEPVWQLLRANTATEAGFQKACMQKADALRILQFLKAENGNYPGTDEERLSTFLKGLDTEQELDNRIFSNLSLVHSPVEHLNTLRDFMFRCERNLQTQKGMV